MKVVCIDNITYPGLEVGKIYEAELIFFIKDGDNKSISEVDWKDNFLNLKGFSEIDWFSTSNFVTLDKWREIVLDNLL